ncbi:MAG: radical SAM protein [Ruminiclostridium sp.]|nr:radical SAM protein [Ruminiclostridium sp.]
MIRYIEDGYYQFDKLKESGKIENETYLNGVFLKSYLDSNGYSTKVLSGFEANEVFSKIVQDFSNTLLAFGISTTFIIDWDVLRDIAKYIKKLIPNIPIIVGGPLAFLLRDIDEKNRQTILDTLQGIVDYIIVEQNGEETLVKLLEAIKNNKDFTEVNNLIVLSGKEIIYTNYVRETDLFKNHIIKWDEIELPEGTNTVPVETSRGCPFRCNFCSYTGYHKYIQKPLHILREELRSIKRRKDVSYISFVDGSFNADSKRAKEISKLMIEDNIDKKWHFMGNVKGLDSEQAKLFRMSGCVLANIGIESGCPLIREAMNKPIEDNEEIAQAFSYLNSNDIISRGYFFVGYPGENDSSISKTIDLLNSIDIDLFRLTIFRPRLNSAVYKNRLRYDLQGKGYLWKHNTCDSLKASEYIISILRNTKPNYDPDRGVYEILQEGYTARVALKLNEYKNKMTKVLLNEYNNAYDEIFKSFISLLSKNVI